MATPEDIRRERLRSDEAEMRRLNSDVIRVTATGDPPETYRLRVRVRSIIGPGPTYRGEHEVQIDLPAGYPLLSPPRVKMLTMPPPFHPNWYSGGDWCGGEWNPEERLARHVLRMVRVLQFDPSLTNPDSAANREAADWYRRNQSHGLFPCDRTVLPDPTRGRLTLEPRLQLMPEGQS
ncbi:MAG TPA: ubiquitin-conjugating enzyme E2 [Thermoanaerobaculia bacterium]|nr:ubiquitin-conjugating enzyme E2 [Thermoanaerobaculia bacterium]